MARYYYLLTAFDLQPAADACAADFRDRLFTLASGASFRCSADLIRSDTGLYWLMCEPEGVNGRPGCAVWLESASQLDEVAALLYQALRGAGHFQCAIVGWEVGDLFLPDPTCGSESMCIDPAHFLSPGWDGLVLAHEIWAALGKPALFHPFHAGYVWIPYRTLSISGW
jgi:hypothetical protein